MITKRQRNLLKKEIIKKLTCVDRGIFDKSKGYAIYNGTNLEMVMQCVFDGLNNLTDKEKQK